MESQQIVICANTEHLQDALDIPADASFGDVLAMLTIWGSALHDGLRSAGFGFAGGVLQIDDRFRNWNGGKYGSQAKAYGYQTRNVVAWRGVDGAIIDAALERAERALDRSKTEWARERAEWLESDGRVAESQELRDRFRTDIAPGEAQILDRIARDAGIVGD